jgi:hypothetical protein
MVKIFFLKIISKWKYSILFSFVVAITVEIILYLLIDFFVISSVDIAISTFFGGTAFHFIGKEVFHKEISKLEQ